MNSCAMTEQFPGPAKFGGEMAGDSSIRHARAQGRREPVVCGCMQVERAGGSPNTESHDKTHTQGWTSLSGTIDAGRSARGLQPRWLTERAARSWRHWLHAPQGGSLGTWVGPRVLAGVVSSQGHTTPRDAHARCFGARVSRRAVHDNMKLAWPQAKIAPRENAAVTPA
jgi:hypothetical protein